MQESDKKVKHPRKDCHSSLPFTFSPIGRKNSTFHERSNESCFKYFCKSSNNFISANYRFSELLCIAAYIEVSSPRVMIRRTTNKNLFFLLICRIYRKMGFIKIHISKMSSSSDLTHSRHQCLHINYHVGSTLSIQRTQSDFEGNGNPLQYSCLEKPMG